jgi:hypothetical protein
VKWDNLGVKETMEHKSYSLNYSIGPADEPDKVYMFLDFDCLMPIDASEEELERLITNECKRLGQMFGGYVRDSGVVIVRMTNLENQRCA